MEVGPGRGAILSFSGWGRALQDGASVPGGHCHVSPCPAAVLCPRQTMGEVLCRDTVLAMTHHCAPRRYDDYDYAEVNQLLERMLKVYIKTVTCYPEKTNPEMFDRFWKQFKHSEKVGQMAPGSD